MADIKLRIELNPNAEGEALGTITNANELGSTNTNLSNTSIGANAHGVFYDIERADGKGSNGLTWANGCLVFNEDGYLDNVENSNGYLESEESPTQFFWGVVPEGKYYYVKLEFSNATNLKQLAIWGDKLTQQFPTRAILDETLEVFSDDAEWTINFPSESDTHTIEFTHWSREGYNATITKIAVLGRYLYIDNANGLKSVESLTESSANPSDIFYGVVPNTGSAEIVDIKGEIDDMISDGTIPRSNLRVDVVANGGVVGSHLTHDTNYSSSSKIVSFDMGDSLADWDNLIFDGYYYRKTPESAYTILNSVLTSLGYTSLQIGEMLSEEIVYGDNNNGTVKSYLESIIIPQPFLPRDTYRNTITKFCKLAQLQLTQKRDGLRFVSARPVATENEINQCISINPENQFSRFERTTILKNQINSASMNENNVVVSTSEVATYDSQSVDNAISVVEIDSVKQFNSDIRNQDGVLVGSLYDVIKTYRLEYDLSQLPNGYVVSIDDFILESTRLVENREYTKLKGFAFFNRDMAVATSSGSIIEVNPQTLSKTQEGNILRMVFKINYSLDFDDLTYVPEDSFFVSTYRTTRLYVRLHAPMADIKPSTVVLGSGSNKIEIDCSSELLQSTTTSNGQKISGIILQNVINDYKYGISDATITVACADYYNENGERVKRWADGDVIEVGDVVSIKKDNNGTPLVTYKDGKEYKWRVKSATFRKSGVPLVDLKLQEIRQ